MVKHGYNEVEKYISGQKNYTYEKTNIPVVLWWMKRRRSHLKLVYDTLC